MVAATSRFGGRADPLGLHPYRHENSVADRKDGGEEVAVDSHRTIHLVDRGRPFGPEVIHVTISRDPTRPERVVADEQAPGPDPVAGRPPGGRVVALVDVAVHDVEDPFDRVQGPYRLSDVVVDRPGEPGPAQVVQRLLLVLRVTVGEVELALRPHGTREPIARVPVARPQLEHTP